MAKDTGKELRNKIIYNVFVRNYSEAGTLEAVRQDLGRIRALGADILWLLPIHPVGEVNRKGSLGSPYANRDYRAVDPALGTEEDLRRLAEDAHALGMKVLMDVVYNHTSPDSVLASVHSEWFYHKADGAFGNKVGEWWDVVDLDYSDSALWDYQIETLKRWAEIVDGFRCDVAPMVPLAFWRRAREAVAAVRPGAIWLAESVEGEFVRYLRSRRIPAWTDAEGYEAFDLEYEYDIYQTFLAYLRGDCALEDYCREINRQEMIYPDNYVKMCFLENHDRERAQAVLPDPAALRNWTAFLYFRKGTVLLYNGQEVCSAHRPSLFDRDLIDWSGLGGAADLTPFLQRLAAIRRDLLPADSTYFVNAMPGDIAAAVHTANEWLPQEGARRKGGAMAGFFALKAGGARVLDLRAARTGDGRTLAELLPDGCYRNEIDDGLVTVAGGCLQLTGEPVILKVPASGGEEV